MGQKHKIAFFCMLFVEFWRIKRIQIRICYSPLVRTVMPVIPLLRIQDTISTVSSKASTHCHYKTTQEDLWIMSSDLKNYAHHLAEALFSLCSHSHRDASIYSEYDEMLLHKSVSSTKSCFFLTSVVTSVPGCLLNSVCLILSYRVLTWSFLSRESLT